MFVLFQLQCEQDNVTVKMLHKIQSDQSEALEKGHVCLRARSASGRAIQSHGSMAAPFNWMEITKQWRFVTI